MYQLALQAQCRAGIRGDGLWLALLVPDVLAAVALPLSALGAARLPTGIFPVTGQDSLICQLAPRR
jgi:hypothetical protein